MYKIFNALLLAVLGILPVTVSAQQAGTRVLMQAINTSTEYSSVATVKAAPVPQYLRIDTGKNDNIEAAITSNANVYQDPEISTLYFYSEEDAPIELIKNYIKSYTVKANDKLEIDNLYGKISVNTWNRNEIKVEVQVKVAAKNEADAKQLLDKVSIKNSKIGSKVSFKTNIAKDGVWNLISGNNKNIYRRIEINYVINMPTRNALNISNQWGIIELPDFEGKVVINCSYTNLIAQSLSNTAEIHINNGDAKIAKLKMSDLNISYGNLSLGSADNLTAVVNFSSAKIGKINTSGVINMQYGTGLQIDDLDKNIKKLSVNSSFSNVKLGLSDTKDANFNVTVRNGSFSYNNPTINMATKHPADSTTNNGQWQPSQNYRGQVGKGSSTKIIRINSSYGSVKFH
jgi:hypothetical protein